MRVDSRPMQNKRNIPLQFLNLWLTLMLIWVIANGTLALDFLIAGLVISAAIALSSAGHQK